MKKVFLLFLFSLFCGFIATALNTCNSNPGTEAGLDTEPGAQVFPGDGYPNPDDFGVSGHGPALSYTDNGNGTFTDNNTEFVWEKKLAADGSDGGDCEATQAERSVHCVNYTYAWSSTGTAADGTLFTVFLDTLNNTCDGDESISCNSDADCGADGPCGFAGFRDWCIPNIKRLQSIVDYSTDNPASSVPGSTAASNYWSATTGAASTIGAWVVDFNDGGVSGDNKSLNFFLARAVRPCS